MKEDFREFEEDSYYKWKAEKQQRLRVAMAVVPAIIGFALIVLTTTTPGYIELPFPFSRQILMLLGPASLLFSGMAVLMIYLQTGFKKNENMGIDYIKYESELRNLKNKLEHTSSVNSTDLEKIQIDLNSLRELSSKSGAINSAITTEQKDELVHMLKMEILNRSTDEAYKETIRKIEKEINTSKNINEIESVFLRTLDRLYSEIKALGWRGNLNLSLGILTTIIGLGILGYFVVEIGTIPEDKMAFIAQFIPRLSLVVLIEIFAYFFLKLYKSTLQEIKYFQNEMTNIEAKLAAIKCSMSTSDVATISQVVKLLSSTERNSILEKGQTTAEIERSKIEQQNISTISERVSRIITPSK